jgi:hypothetical protein
MGIDIKNIAGKALAGNLAPSTVNGGGGVSVTSGVFECKLLQASVEEVKAKTHKQLVLQLEVVSTVEQREPDEADPVGGTFRWYFQQAKEQDHAERLAGDLVAIFGKLGLPKERLFEDADNLLDIYMNAATVLLKPITRGGLPTLLVERVRQRKDPKYFNHALAESATSAPAASKAAPVEDDLGF